MNRYLALLIAAFATAEMQAFQLAPRLVINITIDQLRSDYLEAFSPLFTPNGFKKLLREGRVYENASYPFSPVDRASALATLSTGTTPFYHGIISTQWLDRNSLRPVYCVFDNRHLFSPQYLQTSTIGDEMKVNSRGASIVYGIASSPEAAILSAGHAANNAIWIDSQANKWKTSTFYANNADKWINAFAGKPAIDKSHSSENDVLADMALTTIKTAAMGVDEVTDLLSLTLSAAAPEGKQSNNRQTEMESVYRQLDRTLGRLVNDIERQVGKERVLFVLTSTGRDEDSEDYGNYRIPTGTFYINRTSKLLNVYLSAIYGQGQYVSAYFHNQIYLNHKLIEQKKLSLHDVLNSCQELLIQNAGVSDVYTLERLFADNGNLRSIKNGFNPSKSGDIIIEVAPGWKLNNEETLESYTSRLAYIPFPIVFYGNGIEHENILTPITVDHIAPTIAKSIRIRAPNACSKSPLF